MRTEASALQQRFFLLPLRSGKEEGESLHCLFTQNQVVEVLGQRPVSPVPFCERYLTGFILFRGHAVPVVDVNALLGGEKHQIGQARQLLVMRTGQRDPESGEYLHLAFVSTGNVLTFKLTERDAAQVQDGGEVPADLEDQGLARGYFRLRGNRVVVLDFDQVALGQVHSADDAENKEKPFVW